MAGLSFDLEPQMTQRIFGLLVGINDYTPEVGRLRGCLNDVQSYENYLTRRFDTNRLELKTLRNEQATRQGIIDGFRQHLDQAGPDDIVIFQYSGHGARWKSAPQFNEFYPDGFDEGLICFDSRLDPEKPSYDLADKELAVLLSEIATQNRHVVVILDSCHSGSGTRSADQFAGMRIRASHTINEPRPLSTYLNGHFQKMLDSGASMTPPVSRHILLAACERKSKAFEGDDQVGVFSSVMMNVLNSCSSETTYADLFLRLRSAVRRKAYNQTPQFEVFRGFNGRAGFLGGKVPNASSKRFLVDHNIYSGGWSVNAGAIQGVLSDQDKPVEFSIYKTETDDDVLGTASPRHIGLSKSKLSVDFELSKEETYFAEVTSLPASTFLVSLRGDPKGVSIISEFMKTEDAPIGIELVDDADSLFDYVLSAEEHPEHGDCFLLMDSRTSELIHGSKGFTPDSAQYISDKLAHVAKWETTLGLQNKNNQADFSSVPYLIEVENDDSESDAAPFESESPAAFSISDSHQKIRIDLSGKPDEELSARCKFRVKNKTEKKLHTMVVYFSSDYEMLVLENDELPAVDAWKTLQLEGDPTTEFFLAANDPSQVTIRFMLIVSKHRIDEFLLGDDAESSYNSDATCVTVLDKIEMGKIHEPLRGKNRRRSTPKIAPVDWFTKVIEVELVRTSGSISTQETKIAEGKICIKGHPTLKADVSMSGVAHGARSANASLDFCSVLESNGMELLNFSTARDEALSALEISEIQNPESLAEHPLEIQVEAGLREDEFIVPVAFDGEHILLVGDSQKQSDGKTLVSINEVPQVPNNRRSAFSAFKMYFFKTYLGQKSVNRIRWVDFKDNGSIALETHSLAQKVGQAKKVLLLIHGLLGDGFSMAKSLHPAKPNSILTNGALGDTDTLVLTYDYENLNTPLEKTSADLLAQLTAIGINATDDKQLCLLTHSMGGLVARHLIEQGTGNKFVDHLIMCGSPNGGSPLGKIALASSALKMITTIAVNTIPAFAGVGSYILSALLNTNKLTTTMAQLDGNGEFITKLNGSADPKIKYTIVSGDVANIQSADGWWEGLIAKTGGSSTLSTLFGKSSHDMVVSVSSSRNISLSRIPQPVASDVGCHHLGYLKIGQDSDSDKLVAPFE